MSAMCNLQQKDIGENCSNIELNGKSLEIVKNLILVAQWELKEEVTVHRVIIKIKSEWSKSRDLVPL